MLVEVRTLGVVDLSAPRIVSAGVQAVSVTLVVRG